MDSAMVQSGSTPPARETGLLEPPGIEKARRCAHSIRFHPCQGEAHHAEQDQARQKVHGQIDGVIPFHVHSSQGIIDRKGQIQERATPGSRVAGSRKRRCQGQQVPDGRVVRDRPFVVEKKGP